MTPLRGAFPAAVDAVGWELPGTGLTFLETIRSKARESGSTRRKTVSQAADPRTAR